MKTHTFSIVVGTGACNANCPYCISKMTCSKAPKSKTINRTRFRTACQIVQQARNGLVSVILTSKGETMLFMREIDECLELMQSYDFPLVELQTNGTLIGDYIGVLKHWAKAGMLTLVCISIAHYDPVRSNELMGIKGDFDYRVAVDELHNTGLAVRLNCTMMTNGVYLTEHVESLVKVSRELDVDQLTVRDVDIPDVVRDDPVAEETRRYAIANKPSRFHREWLHTHLILNGAVELLRLPHGASVFDYRGQNISVNNCVTSTTDPDDIRQIIFFPDGRICYDWKYPGARIL